MFGNDSKKSTFESGGNKRKLNSGNACCLSVHNLLSFCLVSKIIKIRIFNTQILPVVLCA
jgi:hypothetical protein